MRPWYLFEASVSSRAWIAFLIQEEETLPHGYCLCLLKAIGNVEILPGKTVVYFVYFLFYFSPFLLIKMF